MDQPQKNKLIESVPNFSEGRNQAIIDGIASAISGVKDVQLLHVDPGFSANRTVYTLIGPPEAVLEALLSGAAYAAGHIDMRIHQGVHPRIGALDVCPLIPLQNISMDEVVRLSFKLGKCLAEELNIPVYLYANSAQNMHRFDLANIRKGEYESLPGKIHSPEWKPDFGKQEFNSKSGASAVGARNFLIAFNVNLDTNDVSIARKIATRIRTSGYVDKATGKRVFSPDSLPALKAIGWYVEEYGAAQVSTNIIDFNQNPPLQVFNAIKSLAENYNTSVTGSELVGMVPRSALLKNAERFVPHLKTTEGAVHVICEYLNLSNKKVFVLEKQLLDY
ncbi:MAG: glutamate formimidoyltransferase [Bacteroidota bacterium]